MESNGAPIEKQDWTSYDPAAHLGDMDTDALKICLRSPAGYRITLSNQAMETGTQSTGSFTDEWTNKCEITDRPRCDTTQPRAGSPVTAENMDGVGECCAR